MKEEWKNIASSLWIKIVLVAIMAIPMLYSGIFLGSMWDPYGNADKIPVAVVNRDEQVSYNGKHLDIGNELVKNLKENKSMDFQFVNAQQAASGLKNGSYYMIITIPNDFSSNAATLLDTNPKKMELTYQTNPGTNYIASKMDETAIAKIRENVSATVTRTYADTLFSQVKLLSSGLRDASDGAKQLGGGVDKTIAGNNEITSNLNTLARSTLTFNDGVQTLEQGLSAYVNGVASVNTGTKQVALGVHTLNGKSVMLAGGIQALHQGSQQLHSGVQAYTDGVETLYAGAQQLTANNQKLNDGMAALTKGTKVLQIGNEQVLQGAKKMSDALQIRLSDENKANMESLKQGNSDTKRQLQTLMNTLTAKITQMTSANDKALTIVNNAGLDAQSKAIISGTITMNTSLLKGIETSLTQVAALSADHGLLDKNNEVITSLEAGLLQIQNALDMQGTTPNTIGLLQGMQQLNQGLTTVQTKLTDEQGLVNGVKSYTNGVLHLQAGAAALNHSSAQLQLGAGQLQSGTKELYQNMPALTDGISQLTQGSDALADGTDQLVHNASQLMDGIAQLHGGSTQISSGAGQLASGSTALQNGLLQIKNGTGTLDASLSEGAKKADMQTSGTTEDMFAKPLKINHTEMTKVANNGTAMAPYMMSVGLYVACMAFTLMYPLLKNNSKTKSGFKMWLSKASVMYSISTLSAILMISALMFINGLAPLQILETFLMAILIGAGFMTMIVFFNITCGKIGSFLILIFMVMQLGGAAGTYPIETSSGIYQIMHPLMPFSYSVHAFRSTLAMGTNILPDILVFAGMIILFSILSILFYRWKVSVSEEHFEKTVLAQFH